MDERISNLKSVFTKLIDLKNANLTTFDTLQQRIVKLKDLYTEFIKNNKQHLFVFGLDSFHFQGKLIDIEYDDMKRLFSAITNRMYCEYFKLFKIIVEYITENIDDKKLLDLISVNNNYPVYKDLEPFKQYAFETIISIHEIIVILLEAIHRCLSTKEHELKTHQTKNNYGLNIDNFVITFNFNITMMRERLLLFLMYIEFFHKLHTKYLKRFTTKLQLLFSQITNDIKFEDGMESSKTRRNSLIDTFTDDNIDEHLLGDLKRSIEEPENISPKPAATTRCH